MSRIDYSFTLVSPFTYLGHDTLMDMARRLNTEITYHPMRIGKIFGQSGAVPVPERPQNRQKLRLLELQRWAARRGLPINLQPAHFPTNPELADCSVLAILEAGGNPASFMSQILRAVWAEDKNIASDEVVAESLHATGHDATAILARAQTDEVIAAYDRETDWALAHDVVGAPSYHLNGEVFWGQDRIDLLEDAIQSGREPFSA